jgi:hypothetical protein
MQTPACGGNPWANTLFDTLRFLDQLGRLAKHNVRVVAHNTLVASDYGLLNDGRWPSQTPGQRCYGVGSRA